VTNIEKSHQFYSTNKLPTSFTVPSIVNQSHRCNKHALRTDGQSSIKHSTFRFTQTVRNKDCKEAKRGFRRWGISVVIASSRGILYLRHCCYNILWLQKHIKNAYSYKNK